MERFDILIAGAGVTGGMIARELSRYQLSVCLLDKANDVATGATKANSGIVHGGYDPEPGTLKAQLNASGVELLFEAAKMLNVPHRRNGSMVCAFSEEENPVIDMLYERGIENGIPGLKVLTGDQAREIEPNLSQQITKVLHVTNAGIVCPYELTIAAVGNAMDNGVQLVRNFEISDVKKDDEGFTAYAKDGRQAKGRYFINCAGCFADDIAEMVGDKFYQIIPRAGEYMLLDKAEGSRVSHTIFQTPSKDGKGILVTPTMHGNLLTGPTAAQVENGESTETTGKYLEIVQRLGGKSIPSVNFRQVITSFTGVRASVAGGDFIIRMSDKVDGFVHVAGIDSPGLTCCVSIAKYVLDILKNAGVEMIEKSDWDGTREDMHAFSKMSIEEKNEVIRNNPSYGKIICRCETVTEGEIIAAINKNPVALDLDGVKRRTRSGMGRCQGGFCSSYVMKLIAQHTDTAMTDVTKNGDGSYMLTEKM
ncbi:MAG: NAD(P)/FAD-dependent oxidoreductase [Oscillospiraceae bacterium]|nr:NAD(P)/FAD-dependent oxidoreductase [Oscillospiraceae bacterium]